MLQSTSTRIPALVACASLAACSGSGAGLDAGGRPIAPGSSGGGALTADFDSIQSHVFTPICTVCHAGGAAPQGLRLDSVNSYALLVGVPSHEAPAIQRVKRGDPNNSYLIQKLEGHASVGAQMPFGGPPLPAATIAMIRQWITDGASPSPPVAVAPFTVAVVSPATHDVLFEAPPRIVVAFNREIDQTRLDASSVGVERVADGARAPVPMQLRIAPGAPGTLLLEPVAPFASGHYRVLIEGLPGSGIASNGGERLPASGRDVVISEFDVVELP